MRAVSRTYSSNWAYARYRTKETTRALRSLKQGGTLASGNRQTDLQLIVGPRTSAYDERDERWLDQVAGLYAGLREEAGDVVAVASPTAGEKGALEQAALVLQSLNALHVALQFFKIWVGRDRTRELVLSWADDAGEQHQVEIHGKAIHDDQFRELTAIASRRFGED
jgi:hypothetical protein